MSAMYKLVLTVERNEIKKCHGIKTQSAQTIRKNCWKFQKKYLLTRFKGKTVEKLNTVHTYSEPTLVPVSMLPVKVTFATFGWEVRRSPVRAAPCTTLKRFAGRPLSIIISANITALRGVNCDGLNTTEFPDKIKKQRLKRLRLRRRFVFC